ncbi:capsid precursor [Passerine astrovirus 4]|nr:capsid precursor [Passerine astrovirus 4]
MRNPATTLIVRSIELSNTQSKKGSNFRKFPASFIETFGRDRNRMVNPKPQRKPKAKTPKVEVKVDVEKKTKNKRRKRGTTTIFETTSGPRNQLTRNVSARAIKRLEKRVEKMCGKVDGPKVQSIMKTTTTIGSVCGNEEDGLSRNHRVFLNPLFMKPQDGKKQATPLTTRASQYNLWKIQHLKVILKPLTSNAMVFGSVCLVDLDLDGSAAKPETIDTIKARPHKEVNIGQPLTWLIPGRMVEGPREGWWLTDTNETATMSVGPALNVSTYMQTLNVMNYQAIPKGTETNHVNTLFTGPLFLLELEVTYQFTNYDPKPALAVMEKATGSLGAEHAKLVLGPNRELQLEVDEKATFWDAGIERDSPDPNKKSTSSTMWSLAGEAVGVGASLLGPWGWLLKGGWWVIKRVFGVTARTGKWRFNIYSSVGEAQKDNPCYVPADFDFQPRDMPNGTYHTTQLNAKNVQIWDKNQKSAGFSSAPSFYLPLSYAEPQSMTLDPVYNYIPDRGFRPGIYGTQLNPGIDTSIPVDCCYFVMGAANIKYFSLNDLEAKLVAHLNPMPNGAAQELKFAFGPYNSKRLYWCIADFQCPMIIGGQEQRYMGLVHTQESITRAFHHALDAGEGFTQACPAQIFLWHQQLSGNSYVRQFFEDQEVCSAKRTPVMPAKLGVGKTAVDAYNGITGYVDNMSADSLIYFNIDKGTIHAFFVLDFPPENLKVAYPMLWFSNVQQYEQWKERLELNIFHDEGPHALPTKLKQVSLHDDSDIEPCDSETDYLTPPPVKIKKRPGTPLK